ncbi:MAG: histidine kinase [Gammaproteobacteria bacterium]|nr:MAG: histidine kinase [Gammaproteobacteria bacterium]
MEHYIQEILKSVANSYGNKFFEALVLALDKIIRADYTFIARIDKCRKVSQVIALAAKGNIAEPFEYQLINTPCQEVSNNSVCMYPQGIVNSFPQDQLLINMKIEGYIGSPLHDSKGQVIGLIVALYEQPIVDQEFTLALFQLFSGRISAEFERVDRENELVELTKELDNKVQARTEELQQSIEKLQLTQEQLIESEKMSALGNMVAGIAHEVNTPLGIAITAESHLAEQFKFFKRKLDTNELSMRDMQLFVDANEQSLPMIEKNLYRAKKLIGNFKETATDQHVMELETVNINAYYEKIISTLTPLLKKKNADITFEGCGSEKITTLPGCHAQLLTNLVNNSIQHGFNSYEEQNNVNNHIFISLTKDAQGVFILDFKDNGSGIEKSVQKKIFEPFYTTARAQGNSGLGMSICYNLVVGKLKGSMKCCESEQGAHFRMTFKSQ